MKLVYTEDAIADLQRLREFIAVHNPSAAGRVAVELVEKIELLPDFPKMGTPRRIELPDADDAEFIPLPDEPAPSHLRRLR